VVDRKQNRLNVRASERLNDGSCAMAVMVTNKDLLQIFPLLWN